MICTQMAMPTEGCPLVFGPPGANGDQSHPRNWASHQGHRLDKFDSYGYSLTAATESKALAAAQLRSSNFDCALSAALQVD